MNSRRAPARTIGRIHVQINGVDLPGRRCGPDTEGAWYENIHVGPARGQETVDLFPGDSDSAQWSFDVVAKQDENGELDFGGPYVLGPRGERYLGLRWLRDIGSGQFAVFRAAKFRLYEMDPDLLRAAVNPDHQLVGKVNLTDGHGWPRCATVRPPHVVWSVRRA